MMYRQKTTEFHKVTALMAAILNNVDSSNEFRAKYIDSSLHIKVAEMKRQSLLKEYQAYKDLTPELYTDSEGNKCVRGLK